MPKINYLALNLEEDFKTQVKEICDKIQIILHNNGYEFIPMDLDSLHMTMVFLGSLLAHDKNSKIKDVVLKMVNFEEEFGGKILEFDEFTLFPEGKKNLIVAKFKCNDTRFIQNMIKFKKSFCPMGVKEENYFTPHITLGKIQNVKVNSEVGKLLPQIPTIVSNIEITACHIV